MDVCFEIRPGEDLHDSMTFEHFLALANNHPRYNILYGPSHLLLQRMDYLRFTDIYHPRVRTLHVEDAEYRANSHSGVYDSYQPWLDRIGRFRSLGGGQVDSRTIFSKLA